MLQTSETKEGPWTMPPWASIYTSVRLRWSSSSSPSSPLRRPTQLPCPCSHTPGKLTDRTINGRDAAAARGGVAATAAARPAVQLSAGAGGAHRPGVLLLPRHVQRALRPGRRRAAGAHRRRQRQHGALRLLRRLRRPRRRRPQPARPAPDPPPRLPHLPALRRLLPLLQPPPLPGLPRRRRRPPRRRRRPPVGGPGRHHDLLPAALPPRQLHLPLLVPLQPRRRPRRPPPLLLQLPPRRRRRQRQRRHLRRLRGLHARRQRAHPLGPAAVPDRPRRRHARHPGHLLLRLHRGVGDPQALRQLEDAAGAPRRLGQQLLLHLPVQQRQRRPLHPPDQGPQQRLLLGRADGRLRRHRLLPRLRLRQPEEEGARRGRRRRGHGHRHMGRRARQPAQVQRRPLGRSHRFQGRPPLRRAIPPLLQLRPAGRHVPEPHLLDHRRARQRLPDPQQICWILQGSAERRSSRRVANRHPQGAANVAAGCELGAYDCQLPHARALGVLGRERRGQLGFFSGGWQRRRWQQTVCTNQLPLRKKGERWRCCNVSPVSLRRRTSTREQSNRYSDLGRAVDVSAHHAMSM